MRIGRAFGCGVLAGAVMTLFIAIGRANGVPFALELVLATLSGGPPTRAAWLVGFALHLAVSGALGIAYAAAFEHLTHRASWRVGLLFSIAHSTVEWTLVSLVATVHPLASELSRLVTRGESTFVAFTLVHMIYGAVVGGLYAPSPRSIAEMLFDGDVDV
ncbi:MAG TPA: hypothetical protein VHB21_10325 [Minicystis sp.]|nr:hypothetical protein [Minicystis sp.]